MDNTAFGGQVPTVPQWTGPPRTIVQVQAILLASLSISLLSAFLAMLGKQWLNRCTPINMRGTIIERSQYRQRKLDGIVNWYFDHVMESLPLMLQAALLLLGCALSRYLWEINTTVASVVLGVTSFGVLFYIFIVVAGAASVNCPYQTPGADFLRHIPDTLSRISYVFYHIQDIIRSIQDILRRIPHFFRHPPRVFDMLHSLFRTSIEESIYLGALITISDKCIEVPRSAHSVPAGAFRIFFSNIRPRVRSPRGRFLLRSRFFRILFFHILLLPLWSVVDACRVIIWLLVGFTHQVTQAQLELHAEQTVVSDLRCISWTLQTSVDGPVRLSALGYLATMTLDDSHPIQVVAGWFDILIDSVKVTGGSATIVQGLEELAATSYLFCLRALSHLTAMDPMPKLLEDVRRRYTRTIPFKTRFDDPLLSHTLGVIHSVFYPNRTEGIILPLPQRPVRLRVQWNGYEPSSDEYVEVARALTKLAWFEYRRRGHSKVPRWLLRFALHSLSQDPLPPASVIADSLSIIAVELECNVSDVVTIEPLDQRCGHIKQVAIILT